MMPRNYPEYCGGSERYALPPQGPPCRRVSSTDRLDSFSSTRLLSPCSGRVRQAPPRHVGRRSDTLDSHEASPQCDGFQNIASMPQFMISPYDGISAMSGPPRNSDLSARGGGGFFPHVMLPPATMPPPQQQVPWQTGVDMLPFAYESMPPQPDGTGPTRTKGALVHPQAYSPTPEMTAPAAMEPQAQRQLWYAGKDNATSSSGSYGTPERTTQPPVLSYGIDPSLPTTGPSSASWHTSRRQQQSQNSSSNNIPRSHRQHRSANHGNNVAISSNGENRRHTVDRCSRDNDERGQRRAARAAARASARTAAAQQQASMEARRNRAEDLLMMEALAYSLEEDDREAQLLAEMESDTHREVAQLLAEMENETHREAQPGLDKILLSMLPVTEWTGAGKESCDECPLCIAQYEVGEPVMRLPCLHGAHEDCLIKCLEKSTQCPICKLDVQEALKAMCED